MADRYYLAYGSNLSVEQMKVRTPDAVIVGTGMLEEWRLLFRQFATIRKCRGYSVPVLVWRISEKDEKSLDRYEGFPKFYGKKDLTLRVKSLAGEDLGEMTAMVYIMTKKAVNLRGENPMPGKYYYSVLKAGYETFGFNGKILGEAVSEALSLIVN